jgi:hypothetical protein
MAHVTFPLLENAQSGLKYPKPFLDFAECTRNPFAGQKNARDSQIARGSRLWTGARRQLQLSRSRRQILTLARA